MNNWIIVFCNYGRLGNRLHTQANILAWCIKNNYNLLNLSFRQYANLFKRTNNESCYIYCRHYNIICFLLGLNIINNFFIKFLLSKKWLRRLRFILDIIEKNEFTPLYERDLDLIKSNKITIIKAWDIRCPNSIGLCGDQIREILNPGLRHLESATEMINCFRESYDCVVGVHARRGDYKEYLNGLHFHSWESYKQWIFQLKKLLQSNGKKKIGFLICSDEVPNSSIFSESFIHNSNCNHYMHDLHALSLCDYLIGPPSSFGTWISWFGKTPRFIIEKKSTIKSLTQFQTAITP